jgi:hypothetical protein
MLAVSFLPRNYTQQILWESRYITNLEKGVSPNIGVEHTPCPKCSLQRGCRGSPSAKKKQTYIKGVQGISPAAKKSKCIKELVVKLG